MRASAACDPMKFHDGPPLNAQEIVPLIWQSFSCNLMSRKCLRPLEMHLSVSHPVVSVPLSRRERQSANSVTIDSLAIVSIPLDSFSPKLVLLVLSRLQFTIWQFA